MAFHRRLFTNIVKISFVFIFFVSTPLFAANQHITPSSDLNALIQQADQTYVRQFNTNINKLVNNDAKFLAVALGFAMQGQKKHIEQNPQYLQQFDNLRTEAHIFLGMVARTHNFKNPRDGKPISKQSLGSLFDDAMMGNRNQWAVKNRMRNPANVSAPFIFNQNSGINHGLPVEENDSVGILDQYTDEVETSEQARERVHNQGVRYHLDGPYITTKVCKDSSPREKVVDIDTNNNPDDRTKVWCYYHGDGSLRSQESWVDGKKHGLSLDYFKYKIPIRYLKREGLYKNGDMEGEWKEYGHTKQYQVYLKKHSWYKEGKLEREKKWKEHRGKIYLETETTYKNGEMVEHFGYKIDGMNNIHIVVQGNLKVTTTYQRHEKTGQRVFDSFEKKINGQRIEYKYFWRNGRVMSHQLFSNGKLTRERCWDSKGRPKSCR